MACEKARLCTLSKIVCEKTQRHRGDKLLVIFCTHLRIANCRVKHHYLQAFVDKHKYLCHILIHFLGLQCCCCRCLMAVSLLFCDYLFAWTFPRTQSIDDHNKSALSALLLCLLVCRRTGRGRAPLQGNR